MVMTSKIGSGSRHRHAALVDRIIGRTEVAAFINRSPRTVDRLAAQGIIRRIIFRGRQRGAGFSLSEIQRLMNGGSKGGAV